MAKQIQLTINNPCHENWDQMSVAEQGRFCSSCQKQVTDFSGMSDTQLIAFFRKHRETSLCGHFYPDQLNRDIDIPAKRIPWLKYFFSFVIPAFLITIKANAQSKLKSLNNGEAQKPEITDTLRKAPVAHTSSNDSVRHVTGKVVDEQNMPIAGAVVVLKGTNKGAQTNHEGNFDLIMPLNEKRLALAVFAVGFKPTEIPVKDRSALESAPVIKMLTGAVGGISVTWKKKRRKVQAATEVKCEKITPLTTQQIMDTAFKHFRVFPNPAPPGTSLNIEWKEMEEGYYMLELHDLSGKKLMTKEVWMDAGARVVNMEVPNLAAGSYLLAVTSKKSGRRFTEKVVIQ